jgi:hypothetical protein
VSFIKTNRAADTAAAIGTRVKGAAAQAAPVGKRAKDRAKEAAAVAVPAGKRASSTAARGVRKGVHGARGWAAPRLEDAADAVTETVAPTVSKALRSADAAAVAVAPKVSAALRKTALQIRPEDAKSAKTGLRRLLNWRWLLAAGAVVAAAGTTAAVAMRRRYTSATQEAKDATGLADEENTTQSPQAENNGTKHPEVNGRVTTPGR